MKEFMSSIKTYSAQVIEYIKDAILRGELNPGDKVNEAHLALRLSISRAPIREALQMLVQEGLIISIPQRGKFITSLTAKEIQDSYFTGGVLEGAAVASAVNQYTEDDFNKLQAIIDQMKQLAEDGENREKLAPLDNAFHDILLSKTDNNLLVELSHRSCRGISKFLFFKHWRKQFTTKENSERHQAVLNVLRTRNSVEVENCIRQHYKDAGERMKKFGVDVMSMNDSP
ncbi:GntR family transcriptional regulator [Desulfomicrobium sp. ZS1]|uniref:GntR family transcriptional regulator n=1 Tax=Desulfomicrobium sp. ZS1 TaxID=2952228 RepID=UPI0020B35758|nr:GntR family transcriptional regulator [Desulfomicrobium sp. ZS1]UTF48997.1 GntR family transcriptional regulator [Desulfomicrobium sp. ZS1]